MRIINHIQQLKHHYQTSYEFKENTKRIVVELKGDMDLGEGIDKVIVFRSQNMTRVVPLEEDLQEGTWIMMKDEES